MYSLPDYDGNPDIYRWNYFYCPVKIGDTIVDVRIAIRDMVRANESQIYNWEIKRDASLGYGKATNTGDQSGVSSEAPLSGDISPDATITPAAPVVNGENVGNVPPASGATAQTTAESINGSGPTRELGFSRNVATDANMEEAQNFFTRQQKNSRFRNTL